MIDSADSSTNTRRSHEVTSFSTPTGLARPVSVISSPRAGGQPATAPPRLPTRLGVFGPHPLRRPAGGLAPLGRLDALLLRRRPRVRRVHPQPTPQRRGHPKIIPTEPTKINTVRAAYSPRTIQLKSPVNGHEVTPPRSCPWGRCRAHSRRLTTLVRHPKQGIR